MTRTFTPSVLVALLLPACFAEGNEVNADGAGDSTGASGSAGSGETGASSTDTAQSDDDATSTTTTGAETGQTDDTSASGEDGSSTAGSTTGDPSTWCDTQPPEVVLCHDFDGEIPFFGGDLEENHATVEVTEDHAVSPPRSMRVTLLPDPLEFSSGGLEQSIPSAPTPFDGTARTSVWIPSGCFAGTTEEHRVLHLALVDQDQVYTLTAWVRPTEAILYETSQSFMGSVPHSLPLALPLDQWIDVAITFAADTPTAQLSIAGITQEFQLDLLDAATLAAIADLTPRLHVGGTMYVGNPECSLDFDDVTVTVQ